LFLAASPAEERREFMSAKLIQTLLVPALLLNLACGEGTQLPDMPEVSGNTLPWSIVVVTGSVVNLRTGPGTEYGLAGSASAGDTLRVTGGIEGWYRVYIPAQSLFAWIYADLTTGAELP
jgi:uncharacterized protein YgiM (DUF1202 family)